MLKRRMTLDEWLEFVEARKRAVGPIDIYPKRTLPRDPEKQRALVALAVARIRRHFPASFERVGPRRYRMRPLGTDAEAAEADQG